MIEIPILLDAKNLIIVFIAVIHAALGIVISIRGSGKKQNSIFAIMELFLILWSIAMVFYRSSSGDEVIFWVKLLYFAAIMVPYIFIYFTYAFPEDKTKEFSKVVQILLPIPIFIITWLIYWDKLIIGVNTTGLGEPVIIFYKGAEYAYAAYMWGYFALAYLRLIKLYFESSEQTKAQIKFVFLGTFFSTILATSSNMLLPIFGIFYLNWFGQISIVAMAISIAYAITRHNLLNTRVVTTEIFITLINIIILIRFVGSVSPEEFIFNGLVLLGVIMFSILLIRSVLQEVRQREEIGKLAEDLKVANIELKKLDQMKSEFVSLASHQLRTPLTVIKGYISMIQEGSFGKVADQLNDALRKIYISNETLINLVGDFLNLSRIESGKMKYMFEPTQAEEMIQSVYEEFMEVVKEKKLELRYEKPAGPLAKAMLDKDKFRQVIMNLVDNAIKYTPEGSVTLKLEEEKTETGKNILFSVSDSGVGMSTEDLAGIFKRFSRGEGGSKVNTNGLGLGLYLAKRIVTDHGGEIWATSDGPGKGSTFWVRVPARAEQVQKEKEVKEFVEKI